MNDPILNRASVTIKYTANDHYHSEVKYSNTGRMGNKPAPEEPLLEAIEKLARLAELFGFGDKAREAVEGARLRVRNWREQLAVDSLATPGSQA